MTTQCQRCATISAIVQKSRTGAEAWPFDEALPFVDPSGEKPRGLARPLSVSRERDDAGFVLNSSFM